MFIDFMTPRKRAFDKAEDIIFNMRMKRLKLNRACAASFFAMAIIAATGEKAMAMEQGASAGHSICQNIAPVIFGCAATIHQSTPYDWSYFRTLVRFITIKHKK